jgi:UDP-N-acetylmuramyl tripeptide synthase
VVSNSLDPDILDKLAARVPGGCVVVAGTNGKTTTSRILAEILEQAGFGVIHNRSGSNLVRGITAAFTEQVSLSGKPTGQLAVIETDEAAFPEVVRRTRPRLIVLLNLFRDQLDRYGELDTIARNWSETLKQLDPSQTVLINADDPALAAISEDTPAKRVTFGFRECRHTLDHLPHAADAAICRRCGASLSYDELYLSHPAGAAAVEVDVEPAVVDAWTAPVVERGRVVEWSWFGNDLALSEALVRVSGFLGALSGLYFTVYVITDRTYREEFFDEVVRDVRESVAVRNVYLALRSRTGASHPS